MIHSELLLGEPPGLENFMGSLGKAGEVQGISESIVMKISLGSREGWCL